MKRLCFSVVFLASILLAISIQSHAAILLYDFEKRPLGIETPFVLDNGGATATFVGAGDDAFGGAFGISSNFPTPTGFQYRLMSNDFLTMGSAFTAPGSTLTITFSVPIRAFTFDFALDDPSNLSVLSFTTNGGGSGSSTGALSFGFRYPEGTLSFSGQAFNSSTLSATAIDFQLDNVRVTTAVPEPATLLLMAGGLPAIFLLRPRRRRIANR